MNKIKKIAFLILGFIGLGLGVVGAILPLLPSFPFLLIATIGFGKSSDRLDKWFKSTKLYKNNLESFVRGQGMSVKTKIKVIVIITALMAFGFIMMSEVFVGRIILSIVWVFHIILFTVIIMTKKVEDVSAEQDTQQHISKNAQENNNQENLSDKEVA